MPRSSETCDNYFNNFDANEIFWPTCIRYLLKTDFRNYMFVFDIKYVYASLSVRFFCNTYIFLHFVR